MTLAEHELRCKKWKEAGWPMRMVLRSLWSLERLKWRLDYYILPRTWYK